MSQTVERSNLDLRYDSYRLRNDAAETRLLASIAERRMATFSQRFGFQFICHAIDHPNRKAGNERGFWGMETGFLPGRTFTSLEDLNQQARQWATERMEQRVLTKARIIPAQLFEHERLYLHPLPPHLPPP